VAHHTGARFEAEERGLKDELAAFDQEDGPVMDALIYADMITGPAGEALDFETRLADILSRHPEGDPVRRALSRSRPVLAVSVDRITRQLAGVACRI
jgi:hypothetical protein